MMKGQTNNPILIVAVLIFLLIILIPITSSLNSDLCKDWQNKYGSCDYKLNESKKENARLEFDLNKATNELTICNGENAVLRNTTVKLNKSFAECQEKLENFQEDKILIFYKNKQSLPALLISSIVLTLITFLEEFKILLGIDNEKIIRKLLSIIILFLAVVNIFGIF